jgi:hypothetical protein
VKNKNAEQIDMQIVNYIFAFIEKSLRAGAKFKNTTIGGSLPIPMPNAKTLKVLKEALSINNIVIKDVVQKGTKSDWAIVVYP